MNRLYLFLIFSLSAIIISCSSNVSNEKTYDLTKIADSTLAEGYEMFYLERASWISTDLVIEYYNDLMQNNNFYGYITYRQNDSIKSIYLKKIDNVPSVFVTFTFSSKEPNTKDVVVDYGTRKLTEIESILVKCRDTTFKVLALANNQMEQLYKENNFDYKKVLKEYKQNLIFIVEKDIIKVFAIQGVEELDVVPFGNDYCFVYDTIGNIISGIHIHPAVDFNYKIIPNFEFVEQKREADGKYEPVCFHRHPSSTPECITSTDICNFLLYGKCGLLCVFSKNMLPYFSQKKKINYGLEQMRCLSL